MDQYMHGKITRAEAEEALTKAGKQKGQFLVRRRGTDFALSMVDNDGSFKHFILRKNANHKFIIEGLKQPIYKEFAGIKELVNYFQKNQVGNNPNLTEAVPKQQQIYAVPKKGPLILRKLNQEGLIKYFITPTEIEKIKDLQKGNFRILLRGDKNKEYLVLKVKNNKGFKNAVIKLTGSGNYIIGTRPKPNAKIVFNQERFLQLDHY